MYIGNVPLPFFEAYYKKILLFEHKFGVICQNRTALTAKNSDINNDCLREVCDDGHIILATHLN